MDEQELLTRDQIDAMTRNDADRLDRATRDLSGARSSYQRMVSMLGEERAIAEYEPSLTSREREAGAVADSIERNLRSAITALEAGRQPVLTPEELTAANAGRAFVAEDCATLPPAQLRDRMRAAVLAGDRSAQFLWLRYGALRKLEPTGAPGDEAAIGEIRELLAAMKQALTDTTFDGPLDDAQRLLGRAVDLRLDARRRQSQAEAEAFATRVVGPRAVRIPDTAA